MYELAIWEHAVMRTYLVSCLVALVIAVGAVFALNAIQKNADVAFATIGVRI